MTTEVSKQIITRFYTALDALIEDGTIKGVNTYCRLWHIDRRNLIHQRADLNRGWFQVSWLQPMVREYGISARWLLTGDGSMKARV
jgi:hypothetical protein